MVVFSPYCFLHARNWMKSSHFYPEKCGFVFRLIPNYFVFDLSLMICFLSHFPLEFSALHRMQKA